MESRKIEIAFYRVMQKYNAYLDPFSVMEVVTLLKPIAGIPAETLESDESLSLKLQSVIDHISYIFGKLGVEDPREVAEKMVKEVLDECRRTCPRGS